MYLFVVMLGIFVSCTQKERITKIEVTYLKGLRLPQNPVDCLYDSTIINNGILIDTTITNILILESIENEISKLKTLDTDGYLDARITCFIYLKGDELDTLCFDTFGNRTIYNGSPVANNPELIYLIKKSIGYYKYIPVEALPYFPELQIKDRLRDYTNDPDHIRIRTDSLWEDSVLYIRP